MKKLIFLCSILFWGLNPAKAITKTSIANGLWSNPAVWSPAGIPSIYDDVIINHQIILDETALLINTSSFIINSSGSLEEQFADTLLLGVDKVEIYGKLHVDFLYFGIVNDPTDSLINYGIIQVDTLILSQATIVNNSSGQICGGVLSHYDYLTNNGSINLVGLINNSNIDGTGKFCIELFLLNFDTIDGTVDICDATPNSTMDSAGYISPTVTFCQTGPCSGCTILNSTNDVSELNVELFPNPMHEWTILTISEFNDEGLLEIYTMQGQLVKTIQLTHSSTLINKEGLSSGIYLFRIKTNSHPVITRKLNVQ